MQQHEFEVQEIGEEFILTITIYHPRGTRDWSAMFSAAADYISQHREIINCKICRNWQPVLPEQQKPEYT